jgi:hypothetical protein
VDFQWSYRVYFLIGHTSIGLIDIVFLYIFERQVVELILNKFMIVGFHWKWYVEKFPMETLKIAPASGFSALTVFRLSAADDSLSTYG